MQQRSSTGASRIARRRLRRRGAAASGRWMPLALLLLSLGVASGAVVQSHRAVAAHRETSVRLLRGYAAFAAWSYRQHAAEALELKFHCTLEPVVHPAQGSAAVTAVTPRALRAVRQPTDSLSPCTPAPPPPYVFRVPAEGEATFDGALPSPAVRAWIADSVRALVRQATPLSEFQVVSGAPEGAERLLALAVVGPADGRVAYGFELDSAAVAPILHGVLAERPLLPAALAGGWPNARLLAARVWSPRGRVLYESGTDGDTTLAGEDPLGPAFGGMRVDVAIRPAAAGHLVGGALAAPRLPLLIGMLLLACGIGAVAVRQLRREQALARLRADFVASVSHELRTPLAQVQLFLDTLRAGRWRTEAQREWILDNMERETTRLTTLVDNVLHFARAERGAAGGARAPVELGPYLEGVVRGFAPLAAARGVRFDVAAEPGLVAPLHVESFRQVLLNLLDNAVKYGPPGQAVRVTAALSGGGVRIAVEDEGPGVEPRERERVWEPFRRGERAVGSVAVGSGIGLAVVREIVAAHEGTAHVEDAPGGGARFVLELPGWRDRATAEPVVAPGAADALHPAG